MVEILARLVVQRAAFFSDGWNIFDAAVVGVAVAPVTAAFSVLRALRVLRLLRLITAAPALQRVVGGLIRALPGMARSCSSSASSSTWGRRWRCNSNVPISRADRHARPLAVHAVTVMTLEGWVDDVVKLILVKYPYAWIFFISFIVVTTFTALNLIIGIIVNAIGEEHAEAEKEEQKTDARGDGALGRRD